MKGNKVALIAMLLIWTSICFVAYFVQNKLHFYAIAAAVGLVMGGIQSLSRSTYSKLLPETEDHATYFSFYDVTEKIAIVLGTAVYGFLYAVTDSMQWSVLALALFFLASFIIISTLKKTKYVQ